MDQRTKAQILAWTSAPPAARTIARPIESLGDRIAVAVCVVIIGAIACGVFA